MTSVTCLAEDVPTTDYYSFYASPISSATLYVPNGCKAAYEAAAIQQNYNGIIFEVAAGSGTITIDAKTNGTHVLNVQIGKAKPSQITHSTRGTADVTYSVTVPTYIYLYASTASANAVQTRAISANSVLLYSYKVTPSTTGIQNVSMDNPVDVYDMRGILVRTKVTTLNGLAKGIYIVNGRKVIVE